MASTRKSQLVLTCNAQAIKDVFNYLNDKLAEIKKRRDALLKQYEGKMWTAEAKREFKSLGDDIAAITSMQQKNEDSMRKYGQVMKDLSGSKLKELKSALREATTALGKMSEKSAGRQKLIDDINRIKQQIAGTSGLTMSFTQAQKQLKNLDNTSMDKLKQGLAAIKAQLDNPNIGNKWRRSLEQMQAQYQAAMATRVAPMSNQPVYTMGSQSLRAEQAALNTALAATSGVKGYEQKAAQYAARLKEVNNQLKLIAENEKLADERAKQLHATQQAASTIRAVYRGQMVSLEDLQKAYATLEARAKQFAGVNPAKAQAARQQMKLLDQEIKRVNGDLLTEEQINKRIGQSGKYSVQELQQAYSQLQMKLQTLKTSETQAINTTRQQMKMLQREINRATGQVTGMAKAWQTAKQNIMMYVGVFAIVNKVKSLMTGLVEKNKELSDSMANIRKVSQWASADVVKLTENMAKIDTRNTLSTLQNLAYQGAKLGIGQYGVEGLTGFVKAAEQVQTALGEDLGEEALPALAKLTEVMGLIPKFGVEQAMQKAGSAIYQLGATSTATGKNIVEFSKRIMGLANVAGVSADQLLGLASASDTMAIMPEVGATAFNKLFNSIHGNTEGIAKAVGIAKEELQSLLYEGKTMEALVKVFEKMQTMSMKELEGRGVFKELGSDGARLTNVMITMANKVDMLKKSLETSNEAFSEGKAVINEYMIQQETAAAYFERASNIWTKAFVNPEGVDIVKQLAQEWYNVSYEMTHSASTMVSIKTTLELIAGAVKTLLTMLPTLVQLMMCYGVGTALQAIYLQFRAIYAAATMAGGATAKFNALLKTNAIALAITAVGMLVMKMYELSEASKVAAEEELKRQRIFTDAAAEALQVYKEQAKALEKYDEALRKSNVTEDERNEIIRQFKNEFGSYLEKLGIEINTYQDMENALHRVNKELKDKAYYETGQKLRESYVGDAKSEQTNAISQFMQAAQKYNIPTTLMQDIIEGKVKDVATAMQRIQQAQQANLPAGTKVWDGTKFGIGTWKDVQAEENKGFGAKVKDFLFGNKTHKATQETTDIYHAVNNLVTATQEVNTREKQVTEFIDQYAKDYSPNISVEGALNNLKDIKKLNEEKLNEALNVLRDEWKKMSEEERKTDRGKKIGAGIDAYGKQLRAMRGEGYTPPPTAKELAKQEAERKKALRAEMKEEQQQAKAIIDNVKNYYQRQINAVIEMATNTGLTKDVQEQMVNGLQQRMNDALANVRKAIGGTENDWENFKKTMRQDLYEPLNENGENFSTELLDKIMEHQLEQLRKMIINLSKELNQQGNVLLDQILRKATENEGKNAKMDNKLMRARNKELLEKNYTGKVDVNYENQMEQFGIGGITTTQARQIRDWSVADDSANIKKFFDQRSAKWNEGFKQARENMARLYMIDVEAKGGIDDLMQLLYGKDYKTKLQGSQLEGLLSMSADQWKVYYNKLIEYTDAWTDAQRKAYEDQKKRQDYLFKNRPDIRGIDEMSKQLEQRQKNREKSGEAEGGFLQRAGFTAPSEDPELARYMLLEEKAKLYYETMERLRQQDLVSEQMVQDAKNAMIAAQTETQQHLISQLNERMTTLMSWADPIKEFGNEVGQAMYDQWHNGESMTEKWQDMLKKMGLAWGQMTLKIVEELMIQKLKQKIMHKAMQTEETAHQSTMATIEQTGAATREAIADASGAAKVATEQITDKTIEGEQLAHDTTVIAEDQGTAVAENAINTSRAAGKTLADLGWWGIPLVAVIMALLNGLLQAALGTSKSNSDTNTKSSSSSATKTKLVSGMLTYDKGNVQRFIGQDGRVYTATEEPQPKDGLVTRPIATTVQGQPALVAERGPEIVIGRETTEAIMMNEPELIRYIANYDRMGGRYALGALRAYDSGNVAAQADSAGSVPATSVAGSDALAQLTAVVAQLSQTVTALQQKGVPAYINKYGTGGLIDEVKSGLKFDKRYNG